LTNQAAVVNNSRDTCKQNAEFHRIRLLHVSERFAVDHFN